MSDAAEAERLQREILRFDASRPLEEATSPPASWYLDPAILEIERARVFGRHWVPIGPAGSSAEEPGSARWGPWTFRCDDAGVAPLAEQVATFDSLLASTHWGELRFAARRSYTLACNWKIFVENYLDGGYHVPSVHPELASGLDTTDYRTQVLPLGAVQSCPGRGCDRLGDEVLYIWIHPGFMINRYGPVMDTNLVVPLAVDRTEVVFEFYFRETEGPDAARFIEQSIAASDRVQREDVAICESVQRGMASGHHRPGPYGRMEVAMHHFHHLLQRDLLG